MWRYLSLLLYSNQVLSFQQPFNRFGISPRFDWGTIYLGSSSMRFSNYTLAGQRFDGAGADLQLGILRIGAMYGRFSREVRPDDAVDDPETFINEAATASFSENRLCCQVRPRNQRELCGLCLFKCRRSATG